MQSDESLYASIHVVGLGTFMRVQKRIRHGTKRDNYVVRSFFSAQDGYFLVQGCCCGPARPMTFERDTVHSNRFLACCGYQLLKKFAQRGPFVLSWRNRVSNSIHAIVSVEGYCALF